MNTQWQIFNRFKEVANILGVHINMNTSKEQVISIHMQDRRIICFRKCEQGLFYTNHDDPSMITKHIINSVIT